MKSEDLILMGAAFLAMYVMTRGKAGTSASVGGVAGAAQALRQTKEIFESDGSQFDNAWRYYDDGTAISPQGVYYFQGKEIWRPA